MPKVGGGMKIQEPGMDLALVAAMLSSFYDVPLPERAVLWGEVDLNGQIRPVAAHDIRPRRRAGLAINRSFFPSQGQRATESPRSWSCRTGCSAARTDGGSGKGLKPGGARISTGPVFGVWGKNA